MEPCGDLNFHMHTPAKKVLDSLSHAPQNHIQQLTGRLCMKRHATWLKFTFQSDFIYGAYCTQMQACVSCTSPGPRLQNVCTNKNSWPFNCRCRLVRSSAILHVYASVPILQFYAARTHHATQSIKQLGS